MDLTSKLESELKRFRVADRPSFLKNVYKQVAVSNKGRTSNGFYNQNVDSNHLDSHLFVDYLADRLENYGLPNHAEKLRGQYKVESLMTNATWSKITTEKLPANAGKRDRAIMDMIIPHDDKINDQDVLVWAQIFRIFMNRTYSRKQSLEAGGKYSENCVFLVDTHPSPCWKVPYRSNSFVVKKRDEKTVVIHASLLPEDPDHFYSSDTLELFHKSIQPLRAA